MTKLKRRRENPRMQQFLERPGPVAHGVFLRRLDFGKGLVHAIGDKDGIISETAKPTRRKAEMAMHFALERLRFARRQRDAQGADKFSGAGRKSLMAQFVMDAVHGDAKILRRARPACRINSRRTVQRLDTKAGIIG